LLDTVTASDVRSLMSGPLLLHRKRRVCPSPRSSANGFRASSDWSRSPALKLCSQPLVPGLVMTSTRGRPAPRASGANEGILPDADGLYLRLGGQLSVLEPVDADLGIRPRELRDEHRRLLRIVRQLVDLLGAQRLGEAVAQPLIFGSRRDRDLLGVPLDSERHLLHRRLTGGDGNGLDEPRLETGHRDPHLVPSGREVGGARLAGGIGHELGRTGPRKRADDRDRGAGKPAARRVGDLHDQLSRGLLRRRRVLRWRDARRRARGPACQAQEEDDRHGSRSRGRSRSHTASLHTGA
jgi:hypothetical protein